MNTTMMLLSRHNGCDNIPFSVAARDYFNAEPEALINKIKSGKLSVQVTGSTNFGYRGAFVSITWLAGYIEARRDVARTKMPVFANHSSQ